MDGKGVEAIPALCLVQASSRGWFGGPELCMREVDGKPALIHTLEKLRQALPPSTKIQLIAPEFDNDGTFEALLKRHGMGSLPVYYGHNHSPLKRMVAASSDLSETDSLIRINGLNMFFDPRLMRDMITAYGQSPVDCYSLTDDYPPLMAFDVFRAGALRKALALLPEEDKYHIHIRHLMAQRPEFTSAQHAPTLYYTDEELKRFRTQTAQIYAVEGAVQVVEQFQVSAGNKLNYNYELALPYLSPEDTVLDIACSVGYGSAILSRKAKHVVGGDISAQWIRQANERYCDNPKLEFQVMDVLNTGLPDNTMDAVISMATIEHVAVEEYLAELNRILKPGRLVFISTPQNCHGRIPLQHWHHIEFSYQELKEKVESTFDIVEFFGIKQGTIIVPDDPIGNSSYVVARSRKQ